jgi:NAD(P)-dependent dehydrogenase (short-subunit alcohol dehydrogenase family)
VSIKTDKRQETFSGKTAIVTGGASGIGAALVVALREAGAVVYAADLTPAPDVVPLDVTDAAAVQGLVDRVIVEHGRLDLLVNNAGICFLGETEDLTLAQWNAIIDVNLRGVVHGVAAAYPVMIRQGGGHIVNTASMGGLMAAGLLTSYVATKHAVVGLSLALRSEAAVHGVGVTVVCPAAVETPMLDQGEIGPVRGRDYYLKGQGIRRPVRAEDLARRVLTAIAADEALVIEPRQARLAYRLQRWAPGFVRSQSKSFVAKQRSLAQQRKA